MQTTVVKVNHSNKPHELTKRQHELLIFLGNDVMHPRQLLAKWCTHHRYANAEHDFALALASLIVNGYMLVETVEQTPKPLKYRGTLTVNPDGTATFQTDPLQYGHKVCIDLSGVKLDSSHITAKVTSQIK